MKAPRPADGDTFEQTVAILTDLPITALRDHWYERFREVAPHFRSRDLLLRALVYRLEAQRARKRTAPTERRLEELAARFAADRAYSPAPREALTTGTALMREWNGSRHLVLVTRTGFQYLDKDYRSLSAVAHAITGTRWNGHRFFRLTAADSSASDDNPARATTP